MKTLEDLLDAPSFDIGQWQKCEFCRVVDNDRRRSTVGYECPVCGVPSESGLMYFELSVHLTLDLIVEAFTTEHKIEHVGTELEYSINTHYISVLLFFCTFREILLNGLIRELCWGLKIPEGVYKHLLKDNKFHIKKQNDLFPSLTGKKWIHALEEIGEKSKFDYIQLNQKICELVELRNSFSHKGRGFDIAEGVASECIRCIDPLILLYIELHNCYVHPMYLEK